MKISKRLQMKRDRHGAIGIGTLIVFIAMVLVAVIAAAVIIKTASELEQSAEEYGDKAGRDTGLSIKVQRFEGQDDGTGNDIDTLRIYISLFGGSESLDMRYLILHIAGTDNEATPAGFSQDFMHANAVNPSTLPTYTVFEISDPLNAYDSGATPPKFILDQQSTMRVEVAIGSGAGELGNNGLSPLSTVTIEFMMSTGGAVTTESASTPGSYLVDGWHNLV